MGTMVLMLTAGVTRAQSVQARIDRSAIALDEQVTLQLSLQGRFDSTRGPDMPDFDIVGRSSGQTISIVNGQTQQEQRITLSLAPKRAGTLSIGALELLLGGKVVATSKPITIRVAAKGTPLPQAPPEQTNPSSTNPSARLDRVTPPPEGEAGKVLFIAAHAPDRKLFVGEPVYVEYVLYTRADLPLAGGRADAMPKMKGFVVEPAGKSDGEAKRVLVKGISYDARVQWRGVVMALGPGQGVLDPMTLTLSVGDVFSRRSYRASSAPLALSFLPVPADGRPADYVEGLVGRFAVKASLDKKTVRVGDSAILTVEVTGTGNLRALKVPQMAPVEGLRIARVPSADLDELVVDEGGMSGKRAFQYLLTPEREGAFDVGRVDLPFFDGMNGKFDRTRTEPIRLAAVGRFGGGPIQEVRSGDGVVGIVESSSLAPAPDVSTDALSAGLLYAGLALPAGFLVMAEVLARSRRYRTDNAGTIARRKALGMARAELARLRLDSSDSRVFWASLDTVVREYLGARFDIASGGLTHEELLQALQRSGVSVEGATALVSELESCAFGRFAPTAVQEADRKGSVDRVLACLTALHRGGR